MRVASKLKFIPVRGRKPLFILQYSCLPWLKFIPERGRKPVNPIINETFKVEIYPREGTETYLYRPAHELFQR